MSTPLKNDLPPSFDDFQFQTHLSQCYRSFLHGFRKIASSLVTFHLGFSALFLAEVFFLLPLFHKSAVFAFSLGILFLTGFSYVVLLFYFQARKPEQLQRLKEQFIASCRQLLPLPPGEAQHHLSLAAALTKLVAYLQDFESNFYKIPSFLQPISPWINRFSTYCYGIDVFQVKQQLLHAAIDEHIQQIRSTPTDLEVHASLANVYASLSRLYKLSPKDPLGYRFRKFQSTFEENFQKFEKQAIEEFHILNHCAPNDPWIHEQLAAGYRNLEIAEEEIREVEILLQLKPQDKEILFRLGTLYFQQGQNAKGLQIYEELKQSNFKRAQELIANYGRL